MAETSDVKAQAAKLRALLAKLEEVPGVAASERERDAARKRNVRAAAKTVLIPECADPARRARLEADDEAWLRWYFGEGCGSEDVFWYDFTSQQRDMIAAIRHAILHGGDQAIAASRGEGKTTYFERLLLKYTLMGKCRFSVLFASTGSAATDSLESIKQDIEVNERLRDDYPEVCTPVAALENTPNRAHYQLVSGKRIDNGKTYEAASSRFSWCGQEIYFPRVPGSPSSGAIIATRGLDSAVRGLKKKGRRVDVACIDDPDTEDTARSEEQAGKLEDRIDRAIAGLGSQQRPLARVMLTTLQNRKCVSYKFTDDTQKPSWQGKRFRFLVKQPDRMDLWHHFISLRQGDWVKKTSLAHAFYLENRAVMDAGAVVANPNRYSPGQLSALEFYYSQVARIGQDAVSTEYDNDPPADETMQRLVLTAYHIQNNCSSGFDKRVVPEDTVTITIGGDVQKLGLHWVAIAWAINGSGSVIDYDFYEFLTQGKKAADCEVLILEGLLAWHQAMLDSPFHTPDGEDRWADLTLLDTGWKDEHWNTQPVRMFCGSVGFSQFLPSKGESPYRPPVENPLIIPGENWHISFKKDLQPVVMTNSDHWKLKVHEGLMLEPGAAGALGLYDAPLRDGYRNHTAHLSFSKHILAETWESRFVPGFRGAKLGWWKSPKANHYFDATYQAFVARSMRKVSTFASPAPPETPAVDAPYVEQDLVSSYGNRNRW